MKKKKIGMEWILPKISTQLSEEWILSQINVSLGIHFFTNTANKICIFKLQANHCFININ